MTPWVFFSSTVAVLLLALVLALYARAISCSQCREPFALYPRACGDLCRECSRAFDIRRAKIGRRRSVLRWIRRTAA